ncbi:hypothetical protein P4C99_10275 [Pontiellaceae bacterium B1224]|nr:hypothetical protein [Pontiellaceae bacterium B1224]
MNVNISSLMIGVLCLVLSEMGFADSELTFDRSARPSKLVLG